MPGIDRMTGPCHADVLKPTYNPERRISNRRKDSMYVKKDFTKLCNVAFTGFQDEGHKRIPELDVMADSCHADVPPILLHSVSLQRTKRIMLAASSE